MLICFQDLVIDYFLWEQGLFHLNQHTGMEGALCTARILSCLVSCCGMDAHPSSTLGRGTRVCNLENGTILMFQPYHRPRSNRAWTETVNQNKLFSFKLTFSGISYSNRNLTTHSGKKKSRNLLHMKNHMARQDTRGWGAPRLVLFMTTNNFWGTNLAPKDLH